MCPPSYFEVSYAINPWMDPTRPVDRDLALRQWAGAGRGLPVVRPPGRSARSRPRPAGHGLRRQRGHGARRAGADRTLRQPGADRRGGRARRLASAQRDPLRRSGEVTGQSRSTRPRATSRFCPAAILAGYGFRTSRAAHAELAALTGRRGDQSRARRPPVLPPRRRPDGARRPAGPPRLLPGRVQPEPAAGCWPSGSRTRSSPTRPTRYAFGLNCVSDGLNVFIPAGAARLREAIAAAGYRPCLDRPERAGQGRRQRQVLHPGDPQ